MSGKLSSWLLGCGIGCGALVLVFVLLVAGGVWFVRDTVRGFEHAVESREELDQRFGAPAEFTPAPDGAVPAGRMEAFVAVREATQPVRLEIDRAFESFSMTTDEARELDRKPFMEKMRSVLGITRSAFGLGGRLGDFYDARNRALLDAGIGMGEYQYIYVLAYHVWLRHPPADGPANPRIRIEVEDEGDGPVTWRGNGNAWAVPRVRRELLAMLRNQLAALPAAETAGAGARWRDRVATQIEALEADPAALPWQDGLPPAIAASFEPYRSRLEATYAATTNPFELMRNRKQGGFSIRGE